MQRENNSYLKMKDYFENLTKQSNFLNSFVGYFQRELITKDSNDQLDEPYLAIFGYSLGLSGPEQNTISVRKIRFAIMYNNVAEDDFIKQYEAVDNAEKLSLKVLARIRWDASKEDHFLYNAFMKESVQIEPTEINLKSFGAECYLELKNSQSLKLEADDWKDIDNICS